MSRFETYVIRILIVFDEITAIFWSGHLLVGIYTYKFLFFYIYNNFEHFVLSMFILQNTSSALSDIVLTLALRALTNAICKIYILGSIHNGTKHCVHRVHHKALDW